MASTYDKASLVMIPSGTKTSKIFSQKPVNGDGDFTFSRSTAATRVNADGNIEKETQNLLLQSNSFDSGVWLKTGTSVTSGQSGYDGSSDAWRINLNAGTTLKAVYQTFSVYNGIFTASFYAKAGTHSIVQFATTGQINVFVSFDLSSGSVGTLSSDVINASAISLGNGWYRIQVAHIAASATGFVIAAVDSLSAARFEHTSSTGNIYIQDAQLEQGLVARDYIETTTAAVEGGITDNVPRLDYTDSSCPALLLEPLRTNLETQSEYIAGWSNLSNVTRTANYEESPEGVDNATRLEFTANGYLYNGNSPSQVNGSTYTLSCYAKRNDSGTQNFGFFRDGSGAVDSAMALTSEWKRFEYTYTATNPSRLGLAGQSGADVSVYGFQIEKDASYATSYIPTYGSSVTRVAENNVRISSQPDLIGQTEGTLFFEGTAKAETEIIALHRSTLGSIFILANGSGKVQFFAWYGNGVVINHSSTIDSTSNFKAAFAYKDGDTALYCNGQQISLRTEAFDPQITLQDVWLNQGGYAASKNKVNAKQAIVFKTRLSNEELAALTTI